MISKDRLREIHRTINQINPTSFQCGRLSMAEQLIEECDEDWLPIADAPKHKCILLFYPKFKDKVVARWSRHFNCWITNFRQEINLGEPTLYQELPEDPK